MNLKVHTVTASVAADTLLSAVIGATNPKLVGVSMAVTAGATSEIEFKLYYKNTGALTATSEWDLMRGYMLSDGVIVEQRTKFFGKSANGVDLSSQPTSGDIDGDLPLLVPITGALTATDLVNFGISNINTEIIITAGATVSFIYNDADIIREPIWNVANA